MEMTETPAMVKEYRMECGDGWACFKTCELFPGVTLQFNDIFCETLPGDERGIPLFEMNYCAEGSYECVFSSGGCGEIHEGGFAACCPNCPKTEARFPLERYRGITLLLDLEQAQQHMECQYAGFHLQVWNLPEKLCPARQCLTLPNHAHIRRIFEELNESPPCEAITYWQIKVLELLAVLSALPPCKPDCPHYWGRDKQQLMQHIRAHLRHAACEPLSLEELAQAHSLSLTTLKRDFSRMFGISPGAYRRHCRMELAARLLAETQLSITEIAMHMGYQNGSKFSAAFRDEMGAPPGEYRKKLGSLE